MVSQMLSRRGQLLSRMPARPSFAGRGLVERMRSTAFALLGVTTAMALGLVALAAQQSWPDFPVTPIPHYEAKVGELDTAVALAASPASATSAGSGVLGGHPPRGDGTADDSRPVALSPPQPAPSEGGVPAPPGAQPGGEGPAGPNPTPSPGPPASAPPASTPASAPTPTPGPTSAAPATPSPTAAPPPVAPASPGKGHAYGKQKATAPKPKPPRPEPTPPVPSPAPPAASAPKPKPVPEPSPGPAEAPGNGHGHAYGHDK
jgi:hypothetical protein